MKRQFFWAIAMAVVISSGLGCTSDGARAIQDRFDSGTLYISCDESFKPVLDAQIQVYNNDYPKTNIVVNYKPEADCLRDMLVDSIKLIIATRGFNSKEEEAIQDSLKLGPEKFTVAYDAVAIVVNNNATDSFFTKEDIIQIIKGHSLKNYIPVFDGLKATSTVRFMLDSVLVDSSLGKNALAANTSLGVLEYVAKTKNAIGFLGSSWTGNVDDTLQMSYRKKVRLAHLESTDSVGGFVLPVQYLIYTKTYPFVRSLVYVLKEKHLGLGHSFADFLKSDRGQLIFRRSYLFPAIRPFYSRYTEVDKN